METSETLSKNFSIYLLPVGGLKKRCVLSDLISGWVHTYSINKNAKAGQPICKSLLATVTNRGYKKPETTLLNVLAITNESYGKSF